MDRDSAQIVLTKRQSNMIKDACEAKMWAIAWHIAECLEDRARAITASTSDDPFFAPQPLNFDSDVAAYSDWAEIYVTAHAQPEDYASAEAYLRGNPLAEAIDRAREQIRA